MFLALSVAGLYAARRAYRTRGAIAAGLLLGAAFCTKQAALVESVAVLAALAAGPRRRLAVVAAAAWAAASARGSPEMVEHHRAMARNGGADA